MQAEPQTASIAKLNLAIQPAMHFCTKEMPIDELEFTKVYETNLYKFSCGTVNTNVLWYASYDATNTTMGVK